MHNESGSSLSLQVLLIEDSYVEAHLTASTLRNSQLVSGVVCANSIAEAEAILQSRKFDVILLDLNLGDSHGYQTFSRVHALADSSAVVVLSGMDDEALASRAMRGGAQDKTLGSVKSPVFTALSSVLHINTGSQTIVAKRKKHLSKLKKQNR